MTGRMSTEPETRGEREEWICVDCWENPGDRGVTGYGDIETEDGEVCGYHYGMRKGYIKSDSPLETTKNQEG